MKNRYLICLLLLLLSLGVIAQKGKIKKGEMYFNSYAYDKAIEKFEGVSDKRLYVNRYLAESYFRIDDFKKSESYYEVVVEAFDRTPEDVYQYASVLRINKKYELSEVWMDKFYLLRPNDQRAIEHQKSKGYFKTFDNSEQFRIKNLEINSEQSDFRASYYIDNVVFASTRTGISAIKRRWNWNNLAYLDLYIAKKDVLNELSEIETFNSNLNKKYHEGPASFSADGDFMVYTQNNYSKKDVKGVVRLELFFMEYVDEKWQNKQKFDYNSENYSTGNGSLSADGQTLFFTSDMPYGYGGTDIYKSIKNNDGTWSKPENLGPKINTEGNESFPFIHEDSKMLFFASDGKVGLGGYDIFVAQILDGEIAVVENLKSPINSNRDDFSFILNSDKTKGFMSSNREGGKGSDDLYSFRMLKPFGFEPLLEEPIPELIPYSELSLEDFVVFDDATGEPIEGVNVIIVDTLTGEELLNTKTLANGSVDETIESVRIKQGAVYQVQLQKDDYINKGIDVTIEDSSAETAKLVPVLDLGLKKAAVGDDLAKIVDVNSSRFDPIYFDLNQFNLSETSKKELNKIVIALKDNPNMKIEIKAHADCQGEDILNYQLSKKRAKAAKDYLVKKGIVATRVGYKGYGELLPITITKEIHLLYPYLPIGQELSEDFVFQFKNDKQKFDELNQLNRRTEFIIVDI